jgi:hypothetical protein
LPCATGIHASWPPPPGKVRPCRSRPTAASS